VGRKVLLSDTGNSELGSGLSVVFWNYWFRRTPAAREFPPLRDRYHGHRPAIMDQENGHCIHRGGELTAIAVPLQQKVTTAIEDGNQ
ncbi:hypothetical protein HAX54_014232, partial [Datura stramonium]|nr:hypothetical protein [Datura stramonium]